MSLFEFRPSEAGDAELLFRWRRMPRIAAFMTHEPPANMTVHLAWFERLSKAPDDHLWIIVSEGTKIGQINVTGLDAARRECAWGYYIGAGEAVGLGGLIPPFLYNFLFFELKLNRVLAEVLSHNTAVLDLHRYHGYETIETVVGAVTRDGAQLDLHRLALTQEAWSQQRRFHRLRAPFPLPAEVLARFQ